MKKGWKIPGFEGTTFRVHFTFWLLLAWVGLGSLRQTGSWPSTAVEILFLLSIFGCVLLHELGHSLAALRYGIRTRDITLLPIGGVARLERMPENPRHELVVALAGPAVAPSAVPRARGRSRRGGAPVSPDSGI
jgi:stage IV sporulation protein FB